MTQGGMHGQCEKLGCLSSDFISQLSHMSNLACVLERDAASVTDIVLAIRKICRIRRDMEELSKEQGRQVDRVIAEIRENITAFLILQASKMNATDLEGLKKINSSAHFIWVVADKLPVTKQARSNLLAAKSTV